MLPCETVTILIPTFNRASMLSDVLSNVFQQTYKPIQVIVYDDGSTDDTEKVVKKFSNVQYVKNIHNMGVGCARNRLLDLCETVYACWWDSDDFCNVRRITKQMQKAKEGFDIVITGFHSFRNQNQFNVRVRTVKEACPFAFASMLFKVDKSIRFLEQRRFGGEDIAWSRQMKRKYRVCYIPEVLYHVRFHANRIGFVKRRLKGDDRGKSYAEVAK